MGAKEKVVSTIRKALLAKLESILPSNVSTAISDIKRAELQADPEKYKEYLKLLDEAYGPREQRAKDLGFGNRTWYHGTGSNIEEFDLNKLGSHTGPGSTKDRFWFSSNPDVAADFANSAAKLKIKNKAYKAEDEVLRSNLISEKEKDELIDFINAKKEYEATNSSGQIYPVRIKNDDKIQKIDMQGKTWMDAKGNIPEKNIILKNFKENGRGFDPSELGESLGIYNSKNIRSVNAAFDPRFKDSAKLLAGVGAVPVAQTMSPLEGGKQAVQSLADAWEAIKTSIAQPIAEQTSIMKNKQDVGTNQELLKGLMDFGVGGAPGTAIGAAQMFADDNTEKKKQAIMDLRKTLSGGQ